MVGQMNINTGRVSELKKQNNQCTRKSKIVSKFVTKLLKYRILIKDILTFLALDYMEAL